MKGYKGFDKDMKCRGFQYAENQEFKEDVTPSLCNRGLHFCESPLDVFGYYPPTGGNQFAEVESLGKTETDNDKSVTNYLRVGEKIGISGLVKAHVEFVLTKITSTKTESNTGYRSAATNTGKDGVACALGFKAKAKATNGAIVIVDWRLDKDNEMYMHNIYSAKLGKKIKGITIKPDTFYWFENGELKEETNENSNG